MEHYRTNTERGIIADFTIQMKAEKNIEIIGECWKAGLKTLIIKKIIGY